MTSESIGFAHGIMTVNGVTQRPSRYIYRESLSGSGEYTAIVWEHPRTGELRTSCNCRGWTIKKKNKHRECKHTKELEGERAAPRNAAPVTAIRSIAQAIEVIPDATSESEESLRELDL